MRTITYVIVLALSLGVQSIEKNAPQKDLSYEDARNAVMVAEDLLSTGGRIDLTEKEEEVNRIFLKYKLAELADGFRDSDTHAPGMHFFKAKELIENSRVYKFLKLMPKGGVLHTHNTAAVSSEWVVRNLTYLPGLLSCRSRSGANLLTFRESSDHDCINPHVLVNENRRKTLNKRAFDKQMERSINLYTPIPELEYSTLNKVWTKFQNIFGTVSDLLKYIPAFRAYHWRLLEEFYQDGIMYVELRMEFKSMYDEDGMVYEPEYAVGVLLDLVKSFREEHPDFIGVKAIITTNRKADSVMKKFQKFKQLHKAFPSTVVGFDLVGQEDLGNPLHNFVDELKDLPPTAKYFFHAGETNWNGASTDINLLDAILLNTTRIGHGYALMKHPVLWNAVKKRGIAIEVSPISNQVLNLVWDLRNHPATFFFSENIPVVICNDDPGFWNAKGLSYDFYYAIMSFAPNHAGLRTLKELAWNSIRFSAMNEAEKKEAFAILEKTWDKFLDRAIEADASS